MSDTRHEDEMTGFTPKIKDKAHCPRCGNVAGVVAPSGSMRCGTCGYAWVPRGRCGVCHDHVGRDAARRGGRRVCDPCDILLDEYDR